MFEAIMENIFFKLAMAVVAVFCVLSLFSTNAEAEKLREENEQLRNIITEYNEEIMSIENDLAAPIDDDYIIKVARRKLNMRLPEEIVFVTNVREK